ncbi:MAG: hypothetical protein AAF385_17430 [Pseudomonadota bacterium]
MSCRSEVAASLIDNGHIGASSRLGREKSGGERALPIEKRKEIHADRCLVQPAVRRPPTRALD